MQNHRIARARETVRRLDLETLFPFEPRFADTPQGAMHYVDEGTGEAGGTVLCLHGNPTWSFLYREVIAEASRRTRVVAPDHIGFGLSDKPADEASYSIDRHIRNLEALVTGLDLRNVTLVMQDWGGPIGLGLAARHPDRIAKLAILNTFGFYPPMAGVDPDRLRLPPPLLLMRSRWPGTWLVRGRGFFERRVMTLATANAARLREVHRAYTGVFRGREDRAGVMAFPRLIPTSTRHPSARIMIEETGPFLDAFRGPARIWWGMKDPLFPAGVLDAWRDRLPNAEVTELPSAKHYVQEDEPALIARGIAKLATT